MNCKKAWSVETGEGEGLRPHKTGQVDIMYTFQFVAPFQVQGRYRKVTKRLDVPYIEEVDVCVTEWVWDR